MHFDIRQHAFRLPLIVMLLLGAATVSAQTREPEYSDWPESTRIQGRVIVDNGLTDFSGITPILKRHLKSKKVLTLNVNAGSAGQEWSEKFSELLDGDYQRISFELSDSDDEGVRNTLASQQIAQADFVYVLAVDKAPLNALLALRKPLQGVLKRSGTVILGVGSARHAGEWVRDSSELQLAFRGLGLLPDVVVGLPSEGEAEKIERSTSALVSELPGAVGVVVQAGTAMMMSGRKVTCFGSGKVTMLVPESEVTPAYRQQISEITSRRQSPAEYLIDLTQWRRLAIERQLPKFPPEKPPVPRVENGTLLIVGGGGSPRGLMNRFVDLAGGIETAKLVYVPCAEEDEVSVRQSMVSVWKRMGVKHATFIHTKDRNKADSDEDFLAALKGATGIFFGGGRQWNFSDSYYGTTAHRLMQDVLDRGGVIAGSSAGASIQGRYLARATPIGNSDIMAPGYERGGLGFIGGVAIDQHFSQRGRQKDMVKLMQTYPQLLGIGLDEATAIEVQKSTVKVTGQGRVFFYNAIVQDGVADDKPAENGVVDTPSVALPAGSVYDLAKRTIVVDSTNRAAGETDGPQDD